MNSLRVRGAAIAALSVVGLCAPMSLSSTAQAAAVAPTCTAERSAVQTARGEVAAGQSAYGEAASALAGARDALTAATEAYAEAANAFYTARADVQAKKAALKEAAPEDRAAAAAALAEAREVAAAAKSARSEAAAGLPAASQAVAAAQLARGEARDELRAAQAELATAIVYRKACVGPVVVSGATQLQDASDPYVALTLIKVENLRPGQSVTVDYFVNYAFAWNYYDGTITLTAGSDGVAAEGRPSWSSFSSGMCGQVVSYTIRASDTETGAPLGEATIGTPC